MSHILHFAKFSCPVHILLRFILWAKFHILNSFLSGSHYVEVSYIGKILHFV